MEFTTMFSHEPELKKYFGWATYPLFIGFILSSFSFAYWYFISARDIRSGQEMRQLSVTGEGKITVEPDIATFTASVVTQGKRVGDAQTENTKHSNAVIMYIKSKGVGEKDIKTTGYSVYPQYSYYRASCPVGSFCPPRPPQIGSYEVRNTIEIKVRDLNLIDDLLEGVVSSGANEVSSINFTIDNPEKVQAEARKKAIDNAKEKAETIARDMDIRLKRITGFSESGGPFPIYAYSARIAKEGIGGGSEETASLPQVQPGEREITSNVTITYEFR